MMSKHKQQYIAKKNRGHTLLLAIMIASIMLAISFSIYSISLKEVVLASYSGDSRRAFAAADRIVECALYWDQGRPPQAGTLLWTIFPTSTVGTFYSYPPSVGNARCHTGALGVDEPLFNTPPPAMPGWTVSGQSPTGATTNFNLTYTNGTCAEVTVIKNPAGTTIIGNGYSDCDPNNPRRTQRTLEVSMNF